METYAEFLTPGLVFLLTLAFGFWLSQRGKPYNGLLFNFHKLIALGAVILAGRQVYLLFNPGSGAILFIALLVAAICSVALFASGALMSAAKLDYRLLLTIHRIAPAALLVAAIWAIQLLERKP